MASTGRSSQGSGAGSRAGSGASRGARGGQSGGRGASAGEASLNASASASGGSGGINVGGSAGMSGSAGAGGSAGSSGRSGTADTGAASRGGASGSAGLSGSASVGTQSQTSGGRSQAGASRTDSERQVPIGREGQQQGRAAARVQGGAQGYGTPFGFMRRFGEEMDRLFSDFGFTPPGIESQLSLLGWPGSGGRSSLSLNASLPRGGASEGRSGSADAGSTAVSRPSSGAFASRGGWMPQVEVLQRGNDLVVRADLPGLRREDVHVEIDDGMLMVSGERRYESESDEEGVYHSERSYGRFSRSIPLPPGTDEDAVQARFTDGVLEVTLPLPPEQSRARRIEIR